MYGRQPGADPGFEHGGPEKRQQLYTISLYMYIMSLLKLIYLLCKIYVGHLRPYLTVVEGACPYLTIVKGSRQLPIRPYIVNVLIELS